MRQNSSQADHKAFEILVKQHHRRLLAYATALAGQSAVAEDLVQEAFIGAYRNLATFDIRRDFGAWMRGIIRNKYVDWARKKHESPLEEGVIDAIDDEHTAWDRAEEEDRGDALEALAQCLERLSSSVRRVVEMFYYDGETCVAIAQATGANDALVRKQLDRARDSLGDCVRSKLEIE